MEKHLKHACLLYRTDTTLPQDEPEMNLQRTTGLTFAQQHGWRPIREFWEKSDDEMGPEKTDDALLKLRADAEQKKFDILLVSRFAYIWRLREELLSVAVPAVPMLGKEATLSGIISKF